MGGISVSIPLAPLYATHHRTMFNISLGHGLLWVVGLVGITLGRRRLTAAWHEQERTEAALRQSNHQLQGLLEETGRLT